MKIRTITVSNSRLATTACSTEAAIKYGLNKQSTEESKKLLCGVALHTVWAGHWSGRSPGAILQRFQTDYEGWAEENVEPGDAYEYENVSRIIAHWIKRNPVEKFPFTVRPENVERHFREQLTSKGWCLCRHKQASHKNLKGACSKCPCDRYTRVMMQGYIDLLTDNFGGQKAAIPVDHKSTGSLNPYWAARFQMDSQGADYIWAAGKITGESCELYGINALEIKVIPGSERRCNEHKVAYAECGVQHVRYELFGPFSRSKKQVEDWRRSALRMTQRLERIQKEVNGDLERLYLQPMEGTFFGRCGYCDCREFCLSGRPEKQFGHMFKDREEVKKEEMGGV